MSDGHQDRIVKQADADILAFSRLVLELRHSLELRHARDAVENPGQLSVFVNIRLDEDRGDVRIDSHGQINARQFPGLLGKQFWILRDRDRVEIDDAEEAFVLVLECYPIAQRAQIVPEMYVAGRLGAAKNSLGHAFLKLTKPDDAELVQRIS